MRIHTATTIALFLARGAAGAQQPGDDLVGIWGGEATFGPQVRGALTLTRAGGRWTVAVAGFEASAEGHGDTVRLALPGGQGELRAHLEDGGRVARGFWVQPAGNLPPYASPVTLDRLSSTLGS